MSYFKYLDGKKRVKYHKEGDSFVTWSVEFNHILNQNVVFYRDIYVSPEDRRKRIATKMMDVVSDLAKDLNINIVVGSTDLHEVDVEVSMKGALSYDMKFLNTDNSGMLYWYKEI